MRLSIVLIVAAGTLARAAADVSIPDGFKPLVEAVGLYRDVYANPLERDVSSEPPLDEVVPVLERTVAEHLRSAGKAGSAPAVRELKRILTAIARREAEAVIADVDGDGAEDVVLTLPLEKDVVPLVSLGGERSHMIPLPWDDSLDEYRQGRHIDVAILKLARLTSDPWPSVIVAYCCEPGTGAAETVQAWSWNARAQRFAQILSSGVSNWAGGGRWELRARPDGTHDVVLHQAAVGTLEHKLEPHRTESTVMRWKPEVGRLVVVESSLSPPTTKKQQAGLGEDALRAGDYEAAMAAFQRVVDDPALADDDPRTFDPSVRSPNWVAFAQFRLGALHAALGDKKRARRTFEAARKAGSPFSELAIAALDVPDDDLAVRSWLVDCARDPVDHSLWGPSACHAELAVAAYFDRAKLVPPIRTDTVSAELKRLGVPVLPLRAGDFDGDSNEDVAFVVPRQNYALWRLYRAGGRWRPHQILQGLGGGTIVDVVRDARTPPRRPRHRKPAQRATAVQRSGARCTRGTTAL